MANATIKEVGKAVRKFRREKKGKWLPESMWSEISRLRSRHELADIAKATGMSERSLRRKLSGKARFCELKPKHILPVASALSAMAVEVRRADGTVMTVRVGSEAELKRVFGAFFGL